MFELVKHWFETVSKDVNTASALESWNTVIMPVFTHSDVFVLDNGGCTLKAGFSNQAACRVIPNCITKAKSEKRRAFIADQVCSNFKMVLFKAFA